LNQTNAKMTKSEYIRKHAIELDKLHKKMKKYSARYQDPNTSQKQVQKINAEMNWLGMQIGQTEERIAFALGYLLPEEAQKTWEPSGWHVYPGIGEELSKLKFDQ